MHMPMKLIQAQGAWYGSAGPTQPTMATSNAIRPATQRMARIDRGLNGRCRKPTAGESATE